VLVKELPYYHTHFREVVQKDGVIYLESWSHLQVPAWSSLQAQPFKSRLQGQWGYNRTTPLERLSTRRKKQSTALSMKLGSLSPRGSLEKGIKAKQGRAWPYREGQDVDGECSEGNQTACGSGLIATMGECHGFHPLSLPPFGFAKPTINPPSSFFEGALLSGCLC